MSAVYDKLGIRFEYPENWKLDEQDALDGAPAVTVYSPQGAFWSVTLHESSAQPRQLIDAALAAMRQVYSELDVEEVVEEMQGRESVGYDMNFYCLDFTNTSCVRSWRALDTTYLVLYQAEDREFARIEAVFQAMTASLSR